MQAIEGVSSAGLSPSSLGSVSDRGATWPGGGRQFQARDPQAFAAEGTFPHVCSIASRSRSPEHLVEAIVGVVTAVVDLVVVALSRATSGRETTSQRPQSAKPVVVTKPNPTGGNSEIKPPLADTSGTHGNRSSKALEVIQDDRGIATVRTSDGYAVRVAGSGGGWSVTSPEGKTTHIAAGQEAHESDGGRWRYAGRSSFVFGANKVTIETKPLLGASSVASQLTVYNGQERVTVAGLDAARPTILALAGDGRQHDDELSDGATFYRESTTRGESWSMIQNGKKKVMGAK